MKGLGELRPVKILLVEDNPADVRLTREALRDARIQNSLTVTSDGAEALAMLQGRGEFAGTPLPDLVLLDLNLPKKSGREVLAEIKDDPRLKRIPVVVLTTSQEAKDVESMYDLHANCFISKPVDFDQFLRVVQAVHEFWLCIVKLPKSATKDGVSG